MIVLSEKKNDTNILHIIIGPETDHQFNLHGFSRIDITEYIKDVPRNEKMVIHLNSCNSEEEILRVMSFEQTRMNFQKAIKEANESIQNIQPTEKEEQSDTQNQNDGEAKLNCPKCGKPGWYKIVDGVVESCPLCKKMDTSLEKIVIPPPPNADELKKIRDRLISDQKKKHQRLEKEDSDG